MNIAIVAETAPAKTLIPIIEKLDTDVNITSLTHSEGADQLLSVYSDELISIGQSRRNTQKRRSDIKIASLVMRDVYRTHRELKNRDIDLVLTCGNAGDVRKGIMAAKKLKIPTIHIEQDIYNPIEMISYADIITVPHEDAKKKLKKMYGITNTINIFQPDILCIGGGVCNEGDPLLLPVKELVKKEVYTRNSEKNTETVIASLGNDAGIIGAAFLGRAAKGGTSAAVL